MAIYEWIWSNKRRKTVEEFSPKIISMSGNECQRAQRSSHVNRCWPRLGMILITKFTAKKPSIPANVRRIFPVRYSHGKEIHHNQPILLYHRKFPCHARYVMKFSWLRWSADDCIEKTSYTFQICLVFIGFWTELHVTRSSHNFNRVVI